MKDLAPYMMSRIEQEARETANTQTLQQLNKCLSRINLKSIGADKELADKVHELQEKLNDISSELIGSAEVDMQALANELSLAAKT